MCPSMHYMCLPRQVVQTPSVRGLRYAMSIGRIFTRAPLAYSAERSPLAGGGQILPPLPNSRTNRRSQAGEAAIESPEREDSNAYL